MTYFDLNNYSAPGPTCVAIGVFDGVHLGHQRVLAECRAAAEQIGLTPVGLTFDPHPAMLLAPERAPEYLCSLSQRVGWMAGPNGVEQVVVAQFDRAFAALSAREFVEQVIVGRLRAREVRVGADFRFGYGRQGSVMDLESMGGRYGFTVSLVHAVARENARISSTQIRSLVASGVMGKAATLLGRPFTLRGTVIAGKRLGRTLGYPTINLKPKIKPQILPKNGVYGGYARLGAASSGQIVRAAISVGTNPTTDAGDSSRKVEAFLMDGFSADLYGQQVDLSFTARIREELKFDGLPALVAQMDDDIQQIEGLVPIAGFVP